MLRYGRQRGDTIVEVLIALAVLSMAFAISYATANRALEDSQNAQEHSLALGYLDAQLEVLHYVASQPGQTTIPAGEFSGGSQSFCLTPDKTQPLGIAYNIIPSGKCQFPAGSFNYSISITPDKSSDNVFHANITWPGLANFGPQSEGLSYRIYSQ